MAVLSLSLPSRAAAEARRQAKAEEQERARRGVFLAFQYPVEIPGVSNIYLLKAALNAVRPSTPQVRGCTQRAVGQPLSHSSPWAPSAVIMRRADAATGSLRIISLANPREPREVGSWAVPERNPSPPQQEHLVRVRVHDHRAGVVSGTAGWLEVLLFVGGLTFVAIELFALPGTGKKRATRFSGPPEATRKR